MREIVFEVTRDPDGGFVACAIGESVFTEAGDEWALRQNIRDAARCHFHDRAVLPDIARLRTGRAETVLRL